MPDFAALSSRIASRVFSRCGDAAEYTRLETGEVIATRAMLLRGYAGEGHISQRRLSAKLPMADIGEVKRGDRVSVEGGIFEVLSEAARDQIEIEVVLREVKLTAAPLRFLAGGSALQFDAAGNALLITTS